MSVPVRAASVKPLLVVFLLVFLASVVFVLRGPMRALNYGEERTDFTGVYLSAQAWVRGLSPYTSDVYWTLREQTGWRFLAQDRVAGFESRSPYPPTSLVLAAPFALLPWSAAQAAAVGVQTLLVLAAIAALASLPAFRGHPRRRYLFIALALALTPLHTGIGLGNPAAAAVALTALSVWAGLSDRQAIAGVALALAICLKPPLAGLLLGYYVLLRRWRIAGAAVGTVAAVAAVGALRLALAGVPWLIDYLQNNGLLLADFGGGIFQGNPSQLQFVNLQYLGYVLFGDARPASLLAPVLGGGLLLAWLAVTLSRGQRRPELLPISVLAVVSLLPIYHRIYDAGLLLLPLCAILAESRPGTAWWRYATLLLLVPFLVPGAAYLELEIARGHIPEWLAGQSWWRAIVVPHQAWSLLVMAMVLLAAQVSTRKDADADRG